MGVYDFFIKLTIVFKTIIEISNWHVPILHYFGVRKKDDMVRFRNGTVCVIRNKSDATAFFEIFFLKSYTNMKNFVIKENDVIVDIGAHIGYFTIYAAKQASNGKVYSFEPSRNSFSVLQNNIKLNKLDNIIVENHGVLKNSGSATLFVDKDNAIGNSIFIKNDLMEKEIVTTISLHDILEKYQIKKIDLLKMDCEGAEFEIILNLSKNDLEKIAKISAEVHSVENYDIKSLIEFLDSNNFMVKCTYILPTVTKYMYILYATNKAHMNN